MTAVDYAAEARHLTEGVRDRWEGLRSALVGAGFDLATGALVEVRTTGDLSEQAVFVDVDRRCYTIQLTFAPDDPSAVTVGVVSEFPIVPAPGDLRAELRAAYTAKDRTRMCSLAYRNQVQAGLDLLDQERSTG